MESIRVKSACALTFTALLTISNQGFAQSSPTMPPAFFDNPDLTANQTSTGAAILALCGGELVPARREGSLTDEAALRLTDRCSEIVGAGRDGVSNSDSIVDLADALQRVQTEEIEILGSQATEASAEQLGNVGNRLRALRAGASGLSLTDSSGNAPFQSGSMASSDDFSRVGIFINADYATGERDESANVDGFEFDTSGLTVGADYRFSNTFVAGIAYHYLDSEADVDRNYGSLDTEGDSLTLYATTYGDNFYLEGSIGLAEYDYDTVRVVDYHANSDFHENLSASPEGEQLTWSLGGGYNMQSGALSTSYYAQVSAVDLEIDGYTESTNNVANGSMAMTVEDQQIDSVQSELGVQLSYAISQDFGVLLPYIDAAWVHEFEDGGDAIVSRYANADLSPDQGVNNINLAAQTDGFDEDYFRLSLGASFGLSGGAQLFINYDTLLDLEDYEYHAITAGFRMEL